jgi:hypothetical protein
LKTLPFEFIWSSRYIFMSKELEDKTLKDVANYHEQGTKDAVKHFSERYGTGESGTYNRAAADYAEQVHNVITEIDKTGKRVGKYTSVVVIFDTDQSALEDKAKAVADAISRCSMLGKVERHLCIDAYLSAMPGFVSIVDPIVKTTFVSLIEINFKELIVYSDIISASIICIVGRTICFLTRSRLRSTGQLQYGWNCELIILLLKYISPGVLYPKAECKRVKLYQLMYLATSVCSCITVSIPK